MFFDKKPKTSPIVSNEEIKAEYESKKEANIRIIKAREQVRADQEIARMKKQGVSKGGGGFLSDVGRGFQKTADWASHSQGSRFFDNVGNFGGTSSKPTPKRHTSHSKARAPRYVVVQAPRPQKRQKRKKTTNSGGSGLIDWNF